jgi:glycosyltransferase involved in cell wall biosynthesis
MVPDAADEQVLPLVSVIIPMYNEEAVADRSLDAVLAHVDGLRHRFRFEVLVVDDGSTDATAEAVEAASARHPEVRLLRHPTNFRLGQALRFGVGQSKGDYLVTFDADLTYAVEHITQLLDAIVSSSARIVIASPYMRGGEAKGIPWQRLFLSRSANRFLGLTALDSLSTLTGLVRAYDGPFLRTLDLKAVDVDVNTEIIYKAQILRARIVEIPAVLDWTQMADRRVIKGINWRLYIVTLKQLILGFLFKPFLFFFLPGLLLVLLSLVASGHLVWTAVDLHHEAPSWSWSGALREAFRIELVSAAVATVSATLGVALIALTAIVMQAKRYFDELYHLGTTIRRSLSDEPAFRKGRRDPELQ